MDHVLNVYVFVPISLLHISCILERVVVRLFFYAHLVFSSLRFMLDTPLIHAALACKHFVHFTARFCFFDGFMDLTGSWK